MYAADLADNVKEHKVNLHGYADDTQLYTHCQPDETAARQHLCSAARHRLVVPRHRLNTYGRRAFGVAGPMTFNALPDELRDPTVNTTTFRRLLKTHFFLSYLHV